MALEDALKENTVAVNNLAAIMAKGGGSASEVTSGKRGPGRPPKKVTLAEVKAVAEKVRDEKGAPAAVSLIKKHGAERLADLDESKYAAFIAACEVALAEADEPEPEADDSL